MTMVMDDALSTLLSLYERWDRDAQTTTLVSSCVVETNWWHL